MANATKVTGIAMRAAVVISFIIGILLVVFGCLLENPPSGYAPGMFVAAGSINLFAAAAGFWGSYNKKRILLVYIVFGGISMLLQVIFLITLFTTFDTVANAIWEHSGDNSKRSKDKLGQQLNIMRWVLIGFIFVELLTIVLAVLLKWVLKDDNEYHGFDEEVNEARMLGMANLRSDVEHGMRKNETAYDKIKNKMALKYGAVSGSAASDWRNKVQLTFGNGRV